MKMASSSVYTGGRRPRRVDVAAVVFGALEPVNEPGPDLVIVPRPVAPGDRGAPRGTCPSDTRSLPVSGGSHRIRRRPREDESPRSSPSRGAGRLQGPADGGATRPQRDDLSGTSRNFQRNPSSVGARALSSNRG